MLKYLRVVDTYRESGYDDFEVVGSGDKVEAVLDRDDGKYIRGGFNKRQGFYVEKFDIKNVNIKEVRIYAYVSYNGRFSLGFRDFRFNREFYKSFVVSGSDLICAVFDRFDGRNWVVDDLEQVVVVIRVDETGDLNCYYISVVVEYEERFYLEDEIDWIRNGELLNEFNLNRACRKVWENTSFLRDELIKLQNRLVVLRDFLKFLYKKPVLIRAGSYENGSVVRNFYVLYNGDIYKISSAEGSGGLAYLRLDLNSGYDEFGYKFGVLVFSNERRSSDSDYYWFRVGEFKEGRLVLKVEELVDYSIFSGLGLERLLTDFDNEAYVRLRRFFDNYKALMRELFTPGVLPTTKPDSVDGNLAVSVSSDGKIVVAPGYAILGNGEVHYFNGVVFDKPSSGNYRVYIYSDGRYNAELRFDMSQVDNTGNTLLLADVDVSVNGATIMDKRVFSVFRVHAGLRFLGYHSVRSSQQYVAAGEVRYSNGKIGYASSDNPESWNVLATENLIPIQPFVFNVKNVSRPTGESQQSITYPLQCNSSYYVPVSSGVLERIYVLYDYTGSNGNVYAFKSFEVKYTFVAGDLGLGFSLETVRNESTRIKMLVLRSNGFVVLNQYSFELDDSPNHINNFQLVAFVSFVHDIRFM